MSEENEEENIKQLFDKILIISNTDENLKFLGKMLNNDSSRKILLLLNQKDMTAKEIADELDLSLSLIIHCLNQMMQAKMVTISKTVNNIKNQPMKYYTAKAGVMIVPEKVVEKAKNCKSLIKSLKSILKFAVIGLAAFSSSFIKINESQTTNYPLPFGVEPVNTNSELDFLILPMAILIIGLITERILYGLKKRKKG